MPGPPWIVLPTYNEAGNLEPLVRAVLAEVPDARVLVVDDASPDGTGAVAAALAAVDPTVAALATPGATAPSRPVTECGTTPRG